MRSRRACFGASMRRWLRRTAGETARKGRPSCALKQCLSPLTQCRSLCRLKEMERNSSGRTGQGKGRLLPGDASSLNHEVISMWLSDQVRTSQI